MSGISKRVSGSWVSGDYGIMKTATDTITTLPANIYTDVNNATVGISGNMEQNGTPTPTTPIQPSECGERTGNLFDKSTADLYNHSTLEQTNVWVYSAESTGTTLRIPCDANTQYTLTIGSNVGNSIFRISEIPTDNVPIEGGSGGIVCHTILNGGAINSHAFTTASDTKYILLQVNSDVTTAAINTLMLNTGSTALPYEPYGYKIPISSASTTTPVYLGEVQTTSRIKKLVLTGEETWGYATVSYGYCYDLTNSTTFPISNSFCSHFKNSGYTGNSRSAGRESLGNGEFICIRTFPNIYFRYDSVSNMNEFKTYLQQQYAAGTPVTVWYILAEPQTAVVNEPLRKIGDYADTVSGISIPTIAGANSFDVLTTLKPSEVTANYHGWHPVADVHERENGAWT